MIEYLYVDEPRLNSYYEQISLPIEYDKVPVWKVEVGLSGPKVEGSQVRHGRTPSVHEKVQRFKDYLDKCDLVSNRRYPLHRSSQEEIPFIAETLTAWRVQIKMVKSTLNIWVSLQCDDQLGALYLIEDYRGDDFNNPERLSGYSSLYLLAEELVWLNEAGINDPLERLLKQRKATRHFARDPIGALISIGAQVGPERRIEAIYRFRASCFDTETERSKAFTIVGYPIVIREA